MTLADPGLFAQINLNTIALALIGLSGSVIAARANKDRKKLVDKADQIQTLVNGNLSDVKATVATLTEQLVRLGQTPAATDANAPPAHEPTESFPDLTITGGPPGTDVTPEEGNRGP